jgi:hypothetical protein
MHLWLLSAAHVAKATAAAVAFLFAGTHGVSATLVYETACARRLRKILWF